MNKNEYVDLHRLLAKLNDENEIKSIVTKEAFENMEYKVGDE